MVAGIVSALDALMDPLGTAFGSRLDGPTRGPRRRVQVNARGDVVEEPGASPADVTGHAAGREDLS